MSDDIDFKLAMRGVTRLKKESIAPSQTNKSVSNKTLRAEIQNRAMSPINDVEDINDNKLSASTAGQSHEPGAQQLFFLRAGQQKKILRDLKKGRRYSVVYTLDLHGLTQVKARMEIDKILLPQPNPKLTCILIIHGKGLNSADGPKLKLYVSRYLKQCAQVKAYCSARQTDGGTGAMYVLAKV